MRAREKEAQFAAAVERHRDALYRVCCAYVRDEADRQDVYQEVLIHLWRSLDDFKSLTKGVAAPASALSGDANLDSFIAEMRARDQWARRRLLGMALILFPVGLVFAAAGGTERPGLGLTGAGIMFVAAYMSLKGRWFARVDYAAPAREFLAAAAGRYRFWRAQDTLFAIPLLSILGLGGGLTVWLRALKYLSPRGTLLTLAGYGVSLVSLCLFAWIVSRKKWQEENAALLAEIKRRQQELSNG